MSAELAEMDAPKDDSAPGWTAIDAALQRLYGDREPFHWAPVIPAILGGPDPLEGVSAYLRAEPFAHWHYITYGLSDLHAKSDPDSELSGFGFELSFRLRRDASETSPPTWPIGLLQNLARYMLSSGNVLGVAHYMSLNGAIALDRETLLRAILIVQDPELPDASTVHGRLSFLQVVGITLPELASVRAWNAERFSAAILPRLPLWVTDLDRSSLTEDPQIASALRDGALREGSSTATLHVGSIDWSIGRPLLRRQLTLSFGANGVRDLRSVLPGRLPHNRPLSIASGERSVTFQLGERCDWREAGADNLFVHLTRAAADELAEVVAPVRGTYRLSSFANLRIVVLPSEIKDADGKVVDVVG